MMDAIGTIPAPQIAALAAVVGACAAVPMLVYATRAWRRTRRTMKVGRALLDVHRAALDERMTAAVSHASPIADASEDLAVAAASLRRSVEELNTLARAIPNERNRLRRRILDIVLPTDE